MNLHDSLADIAEVKPPSSGFIFKSIIKRSLIFPTTSLPLFFGLSALALGFPFGGVAFLTKLGMAGLFFGGLSFLYNFFGRKSHHGRKAVNSYYALSALEQKRQLATLQRYYLKHDARGREKELREQAARQIRIALEKFSAIQNILAGRFQKTELTYSRYLGAAKEVYLLIIDNLIRVREVLVSVDSIDINHAAKRLSALEKQGTLTDADVEEQRALLDRKGLYNSQWQQVSSLLTQNEQALTSFSKTAAALNELDISTSARSSFSPETAMEELSSLAERAVNLRSSR